MIVTHNHFAVERTTSIKIVFLDIDQNRFGLAVGINTLKSVWMVAEILK
jgi:hypothetical protein